MSDVGPILLVLAIQVTLPVVGVGLDLRERLELAVMLTCERPEDAKTVHTECIEIVTDTRKVAQADKSEPKSDLEKLGKKLSIEMIESTTISNRVGGERVDVWIRSETGLSEFLKAFGSAGGK